MRTLLRWLDSRDGQAGGTVVLTVIAVDIVWLIHQLLT